MYRTRNAACPHGYRGFESHPLRQFSPKMGTPIPAGNGGERAKQLSLRSHDANFGFAAINLSVGFVKTSRAPVEVIGAPMRAGD